MKNDTRLSPEDRDENKPGLNDNGISPATDADRQPGKHAAKPRKPLWLRLLKILGWTAGCVVGLVVLALCLAAWILTPERLTPLVEKYGSEYLKADVKAKRVELTVWSSFPDVRLDITDLRLTSRTLQGQPDSVTRKLGPDAAKLLSLGSFSGSINPWYLLKGTIKIGDIKADGLGLNLVSGGDGINNYDIIPPSEEKEQEESSPWEVRFGKISVRAEGGVRYFDAQSGTDVFLSSPALLINPLNEECTSLDTSLRGELTLKMDGEPYFSNWHMETSGKIDWNLKTMDFNLPDYSVSLNFLTAKLHTALNLGDKMCLNSCKLEIEPVPVAPLITHLPEDIAKDYPMLKGLDTDMKICVDAEVKCPWTFTSPQLPDVTANLNIPACRLKLTDNGAVLIDLNELNLQATLSYKGSAPEKSSLRVPLWSMKSNDMDLTLEARADELLGDNPLIRILSRGHLDLRSLAALIPVSGSVLTGTVDADAEMNARMDDLVNLRYEKIEMNGNVQVRDLLLEIPVSATRLYSKLITLRFGTAVDDMGPRVPGTLLARAETDTLHVGVTDINLGLSGAVLKAGTRDELLRKKNPKEIVPMGVSFSAHRIRLNSESDTTKVRATSLKADGSITRYEGNSESPLLKARLAAVRLLYSDPTMRLGMKNLNSSLDMHLRKRKKGKKKRATRPEETHVVKMEMDEGVKNLFKTWGINGNISTDKTRLTYINYPVPVNVSGLDMDFSLDSIRLRSAYLRTQSNAMSLSGTIANLRHFMLGRTRKPLKIRLLADIDSLDINQVAFNFMLGSALQTQRGYLARLSEEEQDAIVKAAAAIDTVASLSSDTLPLIIPRNIDADARLRANYARYGDISLYRLRTDLLVNDGAASVDSLQASTDFGNAYLNLLYSSRNPELLNLAVDLGFSDINLQDFYRTFPTVTEMAPAITDLSGMVGAKLVGSFDMYPNMDIDFNSMNAMLNLSGSGLELQQSPLIRKVARMMLIRKKGPLQITDMNIQVSLHDNVLRLYPFKFGMEKYRFALLGQNDMAENMFYHLSVLKSPIPFKFGINIKGTFDKPKIRFGGAKYKENEAQEMEDLIENQRVNFVRAMRLELRRLINKAAVSYTERPSFSAYGLDKELKRKDDSNEDDSRYDSPIQMLGNTLKTPALRALGNSSNALQDFYEKHNIGKEKDSKDKKKKDKKK